MSRACPARWSQVTGVCSGSYFGLVDVRVVVKVSLCVWTISHWRIPNSAVSLALGDCNLHFSVVIHSVFREKKEKRGSGCFLHEFKDVINSSHLD